MNYPVTIIALIATVAAVFVQALASGAVVGTPAGWVAVGCCVVVVALIAIAETLENAAD